MAGIPAKQIGVRGEARKIAGTEDYPDSTSE
jgi:hypothetical protein